MVAITKVAAALAAMSVTSTSTPKTSSASGATGMTVASTMTRVPANFTANPMAAFSSADPTATILITTVKPTPVVVVLADCNSMFSVTLPNEVATKILGVRTFVGLPENPTVEIMSQNSCSIATASKTTNSGSSSGVNTASGSETAPSSVSALTTPTSSETSKTATASETGSVDPFAVSASVYVDGEIPNRF